MVSIGNNVYCRNVLPQCLRWLQKGRPRTERFFQKSFEASGHECLVDAEDERYLQIPNVPSISWEASKPQKHSAKKTLTPKGSSWNRFWWFSCFEKHRFGNRTPEYVWLKLWAVFLLPRKTQKTATSLGLAWTYTPGLRIELISRRILSWSCMPLYEGSALYPNQGHVLIPGGV